jgi:hypothetical protein
LICKLPSNFRDFTWSKFSDHNLLSLVLKDQKPFLSLTGRVPLTGRNIAQETTVCSSKGEALQLASGLDFLSIQAWRLWMEYPSRREDEWHSPVVWIATRSGRVYSGVCRESQEGFPVCRSPLVESGGNARRRNGGTAWFWKGKLRATNNKRVAEISATLSSKSNHRMRVRTCMVVHMMRILAPDGSTPRGVLGARRGLLKPLALVHYGRISN